jgi:uncharacterized membrane protein (UPF0127 family)
VDVAKDSEHRLHDGNGLVLLDRLRFARSTRTRVKGLLGRRSLEPGEGLAFKERSVHTFFMRMPIDVVFLDRDLRVVKVAARVGPWRVAGAKGARYVIEIAPGRAAELGVAEGAKLAMEPPP